MSGQPHNRLVLHLDTSSGQRFSGAVTEAEVEDDTATIVAEFPRQNAPTLQIGEGVSLSFPGLRPGHSFHSLGQAVTRSEDRWRLRYRFEMGQAVGPALAALADFRFATRVQPLPKAPIRATIEHCNQGPRFSAEVKNISATGVGLRVSMEDDLQLSSTWKLKVSLALPGGQQTFEMIGNVCYRRLEGKAILYGVDFDAKATLDFDGKQEVIHTYVWGCQAAAIYRLPRG